MKSIFKILCLLDFLKFSDQRKFKIEIVSYIENIMIHISHTLWSVGKTTAAIEQKLIWIDLDLQPDSGLTLQFLWMSMENSKLHLRNMFAFES